MLIASYANVVPTTTDPAFDYVATIDLMYSKDIHYARVWHFLAFADDPDSVFWPWVKYAGSAPACYDTSKEKWDLRVNGSDKIHSPDDLDYWPRMRGIQGVQPGAIPYASDRCITSEIMLFDKSGMLAGAWTNNPWAGGNNLSNVSEAFDSPLPLPSCDLQGIPSQSGQAGTFYDSTLSDVRAAQGAYVSTLIDETVNHNVIYEIENEHHNPDNDYGTWAKYWATFIKDRIVAKNHPQRLVSHSSLSHGPWVFNADPTTWTDLDQSLAGSDSKVDIINRHLGPNDEQVDDTGFAALLNNLNQYIRTRWSYRKAINIDEFGNETTVGVAGSYENAVARLRKMAWVIVTSGGHFHLEDVKVDSTDAFAIVKNIHAFLRERRWNFVGSKPDSTLSDQPFCMAPDPSGPGGTQDYVCYYTAATAGVTLHGLPAGQYYVRWWNPRTVPAFSGAYINHPGGDLHETPPDSLDWVLFVRNGASGPHQEPYDVAVTKDDGVAIIQPGQPLTYAIKVTNPGTADVSGVTVTDAFPAALQGVTWTCAAAGGAFCPGSGSGNINQVAVDLPAGSSATFTATGTLSSTPPDPIANTATLTMPPGVTDPDLSSNSATDVDTTIGGSGAAFGFYTLTPCRVVDTRDLGAPIGGPILQMGQTRDFTMVGKCGIPSTAKALSLNVTVTQPSAQGFVRLAPPGISATSTVNFQAGDTRANNAIVSLVDGKLSAEARGLPGSVHLIIDVNGYFQ